MTRKQMKLEAKQALKGNWGAAIGIVIAYALITFALSYIYVGTFFTGIFLYGVMAAFLLCTRTGKLEFKDLFSGFKNFAPVFVATLMKLVYLALWTLLFVIPGFVKSYCLAPVGPGITRSLESRGVALRVGRRLSRACYCR